MKIAVKNEVSIHFSNKVIVTLKYELVFSFLLKGSPLYGNYLAFFIRHKSRIIHSKSS